MRLFIFVTLVAAALVAQDPGRPGIYRTSAAIAGDLARAGAVSRTGTTSTIVNTEHYHAVVRRRDASGTPQNAIIHPGSSEVYQIMEGSGTLVTGGVLDPPPGIAGTIQNAGNITSTSIKGGTAQRVAKGDVVFVPAGTPHWFSTIDTSITYLEVQFETN